ncbi:EAL domain-containing protein [uncultured Roseovarius sp.]|uniref:putative bifunctional diguanylate cyclase/phosphodiesterase n=1 Tax=uncultured Roseovarius sp. TaxID=293344 RepID=UPI0026326692|nr:EAL domain-containing protein [uncultured Roseovarius sp.]
MPDDADISSSVFALIVNQIREGICLQDIHGRIEWINPACEEMFGWRRHEIVGRRALEIVTPPGRRKLGTDAHEFTYDFSSTIFDRIVVQEFQRRNGSRFWLQQSFAVLDLGPSEDQKKVVITCQDVTAQVKIDRKFKQIHDNLEYAAYHDDLTGLANRKKLGTFLESDQVAQAIRNGTIGVLQIDIDKFKDINDNLGHAAGDATLRHVSAALRQSCPPENLACRTGGDEFLMICLTSGTPEVLQENAEGLLAAISTPMRWKDQELRIGASIGASLATSPDDTGEELILRADKALYTAKRGGRGHVALYTDAMGQKYRAQMKTVRELKNAIADEQFEIHLQPQLHLSSAAVTGCEALIRWNHPERGLLNPGQFLPAAEAAGLASDIDYISMNLALDALVELRQGGFPDLCMSINVSSAILGDVNYPGLLDWALQSRDIDPGSICIEILETTILEGGDLEIATAIERLKHLGVHIALDDFGTGYAGLAHMSSFDVDAIKLDRSMISRLANDPRTRMVVRSIIRLCDLLDINVVAEGVETAEQLEILRRAKCPLIQGFGLARPMPVATTLDWFKSSTPLAAPVSFAATPKADISQIGSPRTNQA